MDESTIIVIEPGELDTDTRKMLEEHGFVVIEAKNPDKVRFVKPMPEFGGSKLLAASVETIYQCDNTSVKDSFLKKLVRIIKENHQ